MAEKSMKIAAIFTLIIDFSFIILWAGLKKYTTINSSIFVFLIIINIILISVILYYLWIIMFQKKLQKIQKQQQMVHKIFNIAVPYSAVITVLVILSLALNILVLLFMVVTGRMHTKNTHEEIEYDTTHEEIEYDTTDEEKDIFNELQIPVTNFQLSLQQDFDFIKFSTLFLDIIQHDLILLNSNQAKISFQELIYKFMESFSKNTTDTFEEFCDKNIEADTFQEFCADIVKTTIDPEETLIFTNKNLADKLSYFYLLEPIFKNKPKFIEYCAQVIMNFDKEDNKKYIKLFADLIMKLQQYNKVKNLAPKSLEIEFYRKNNTGQHENLIEIENATVHIVLYTQLKFNEQESINEQQFNKIWEELPTSYYRQWQKTKKRFNNIAGDKGKLELENLLTDYLNPWAKQEGENGGSYNIENAFDEI